MDKDEIVAYVIGFASTIGLIALKHYEGWILFTLLAGALIAGWWQRRNDEAERPDLTPEHDELIAIAEQAKALREELERVQAMSLSECGLGFVDLRVLNSDDLATPVLEKAKNARKASN